MPIRRQHGQVKTIAKLGALAGKSLAARRDYERREQMLWEAQKMQRESELRQHAEEAQFNRTIMAMDWENQKIMMRSQHDFALEEMKQEAFTTREVAKQVKKMNEYDLAKDKLREHLADRNITQDQYNSALANLDMKILGQGGTIPSGRGGTSLSRQASEIESAYMLQGYTPQDLQEIGLQPEKFPGVPSGFPEGEGDISGLSDEELRLLAGME